MPKTNVFVTGATGTMGFESLKQLVEHLDIMNLTILVRDSEKNRKILTPYMNLDGLKIVWGDLLDKDKVMECVKDADIVLHIAAFVSQKQIITLNRQ